MLTRQGVPGNCGKRNTSGYLSFTLYKGEGNKKQKQNRWTKIKA